jgi:hypothetical protein
VSSFRPFLAKSFALLLLVLEAGDYPAQGLASRLGGDALARHTVHGIPKAFGAAFASFLLGHVYLAGVT